MNTLINVPSIRSCPRALCSWQENRRINTRPDPLPPSLPRFAFFCGEEDYLAYRHGLSEAFKESGCALHAYVLMTPLCIWLLTSPQPQTSPGSS